MTAKHKFGLSGTSCAGKTTLAYGLVERLKRQGVLADGVFNQDRKFSFDRALLEVDERAQHWMINNHIAKDVEMSLHGDTDLLVMDRTPIDYMAYYMATKYASPMQQGRRTLWDYCVSWVRNTYTAVYYLPPLPFQDDGKRPDREFVGRVDQVLLDLLVAAEREGVLVLRLDRDQVFNDICKRADIVKAGAKTELTEYELQMIPSLLQVQRVAIKEGNDYDIWVETAHPVDDTVHQSGPYLQVLRGALGTFVPFDLHFTTDLTTLTHARIITR